MAWWANGKVAPVMMGEVCNKGYLTVRNNSVANCQRLGTRRSTGLEVFAMLKDECGFDSRLGATKKNGCSAALTS